MFIVHTKEFVNDQEMNAEDIESYDDEQNWLMLN